MPVGMTCESCDRTPGETVPPENPFPVWYCLDCWNRTLTEAKANAAREQREACALWLEQSGIGADGKGPLRAERVRSTPLVA